MDVVDTQVHINLLGDYGAAIAAMDAAGVRSVLIDERWEMGGGASRQGYTLPSGVFRASYPISEQFALTDPERFGYVVRFDPADPDLDALVGAIPGIPGRLGIRHSAYGRADAYEKLAAGYDEPLFAAAQKHGVPIFMLTPGRTSVMRPYMEKFTDLQIIVDHCGLVLATDARGAAAFEGFDEVLELAKYPNVALKWCHAPRLSAEPYPFTDVVTMLARAVAAFGPERVMFASDHTASKFHHSWAEALHCIRDSPQLSESGKEWVLGRSARTILNWELPASAG